MIIKPILEIYFVDFIIIKQFRQIPRIEKKSAILRTLYSCTMSTLHYYFNFTIQMQFVSRVTHDMCVL